MTTTQTPTTTPETSESGAKRGLMRHGLATLAYRGGKALRGSPEGFADFRASPSTRTPGEILAHLGDLLGWASSMAKGERHWKPSAPLPWEAQKARFFAALEELDQQLAAAPLAGGASSEKLFQGPIADALQHVGQLTMLRRLAGAPIRGENYFVADIVTGRAGAEQSPPVKEFD